MSVFFGIFLVINLSVSLNWLVNCVGRMYDYPDELCRSPIDVLWSMINMNIGAMLTMTHIVLKGMKERKRGAIVNISSGSELFPIPYCTLYAATKVNWYLLNRCIVTTKIFHVIYIIHMPSYRDRYLFVILQLVCNRSLHRMAFPCN